jgi:hypothetical protein
VHLFAVSLMPFATAWIASTRLGAVPVAFYAGDFFLVNVTYLLLCLEAVDRSSAHKVEPRARSMMRMRSLVDAGGVCRRGSRRPSLSNRRHGDDLPLPDRLPEPGGTGHYTSTQVT